MGRVESRRTCTVVTCDRSRSKQDRHPAKPIANGATQRLRWKFDTPFGRDIYSRRMGTVEPVFGNLQNKGMRRFTLRGQRKVSAQWKLHFMMVHNIEKVAGAAMPH